MKTHIEKCAELKVGDVIRFISSTEEEEIKQIIHNDPNDFRNTGDGSRITINGFYWYAEDIVIVKSVDTFTLTLDRDWFVSFPMKIKSNPIPHYKSVFHRIAAFIGFGVKPIGYSYKVELNE